MKTIVLLKKVESYTVSIATVSINDLTVSIQAHLLPKPQDVSTSLLLYGTPFFFYKCIVFEISCKVIQGKVSDFGRQISHYLKYFCAYRIYKYTYIEIKL